MAQITRIGIIPEFRQFQGKVTLKLTNQLNKIRVYYFISTI